MSGTLFADAKRLTRIRLTYTLNTFLLKARLNMDKKAVTERLRALASNDKKRSKAARLRDVIDEVEAVLAAGVTRAAVHEELKAHLDMSFQTFIGTLQRIRAKRGKPQQAQPAAVSKPVANPEAARTVEPESQESQAVQVSHNPADIDKIMGSNPDLQALAKLGKRKSK
jgi:hypothetical protein